MLDVWCWSSVAGNFLGCVMLFAFSYLVVRTHVQFVYLTRGPCERYGPTCQDVSIFHIFSTRVLSCGPLAITVQATLAIASFANVQHQVNVCIRYDRHPAVMDAIYELQTAVHYLKASSGV